MGRRRKAGGVKNRRMHVDLHQKKKKRRQKDKYRIQHGMLCTSWVCAGTFVDHEWVPESTISQHVEEVMGMELDYEFDIPCVVQWSILWFSATTRLNGILGEQDLKFFLKKKTTKVVERAITDVISRPFGWEHTPRSCMLASVAKVLHRTHRKWSDE